MSVFESLRSLLSGWSGRSAADREMEEEMRLHLDMETERNIAFGMDPEAARRKAVLSFGGIERFKEVVREERPERWLDDLVQDVRYSLRMLRRAPLFTFVAVASLALGVGANTAVFSLVRGVLLRSLPYPAADRLQWIYVEPLGTAKDVSQGKKGPTRAMVSLSPADYHAIRQNSRSYSAVGTYLGAQGGVSLSGMGEAEVIPATYATSGVFDALGVQPELGRSIRSEDDIVNAPDVVVLSHSIWRERFGGDRDVIGRTIRLNGNPTTVVGVMPASFKFPGAPDDRMWLSLQIGPAAQRAPFFLTVIARLAPGATEARAQSELVRLEKTVKSMYPASPTSWRYGVIELKDSLVSDARPTLLLLFGAVALVLLIATSNIANLLLARATTRAPELALRASLGARRARIVRQLITESLVISLAGTLCGVLLAYWGLRFAASNRIGSLPRMDEVRLDATVLVFTLGVALAVGVVTGLVPALRLSREDLAARLREGGRSLAGGSGTRLRNALVVGEFALALMVLIAAGLLLNSLVHLQRVRTGIAADNLIAIRVNAPPGTYKEPEQRAAFFQAIRDRVAGIHGVGSVAITMALPPDRLVMSNPFTPQGKVYAHDEGLAIAQQLSISPGTLQTFGVPLLRGRDFTEADRDSMPAVAIVNVTLAEKYLGGKDAALGKWIQTGEPNPKAPHVEVVGVVPDVKFEGLDAKPTPTIYVPFRQFLWWPTQYIVMRTDMEPAKLLPQVRAALAQVDPNVPIMQTLTMDDLRGGAVAKPRVRTMLLSSFALLALLLATAGIYGVLSYTVTQQRRETGVRIALGATPGDILQRTLRGGMRLAAYGIALGLVGALLLARATTSLLFGVAAVDPLTYLAATLMLVTVGAVACALPALRAARTDPSVAFRGD